MPYPLKTFMVQLSVYARICNGRDSVALPSNGSVRMLVITERQYSTIELLIGKPNSSDATQDYEQLMLF